MHRSEAQVRVRGVPQNSAQVYAAQSTNRPSEPDKRLSRIRLSDTTSRLHPRHVVPISVIPVPGLATPALSPERTFKCPALNCWRVSLVKESLDLVVLGSVSLRIALSGFVVLSTNVSYSLSVGPTMGTTASVSRRDKLTVLCRERQSAFL